MRDCCPFFFFSRSCSTAKPRVCTSNESNVSPRGLLPPSVTATFPPLGFNGISDQGAASLARSLNQNNSLRTLYLSGNSIGAAGAGALAEALARNTGLATLHLSVRADHLIWVFVLHDRLQAPAVGSSRSDRTSYDRKLDGSNGGNSAMKSA